MVLWLPNIVWAENKLERPHWSMEVKGGLFYPDADNWEKFYGSDKTHQFGAYAAWKMLNFLELGLEGAYIRDRGKGALSSNSAQLAGSVKYELFPLSAQVLLRLKFSENQWIVPYAAAGVVRAYYQETIKNQEKRTGARQGELYRGGLQILLDVLDRRGSGYMAEDFNVRNTYLTLEVSQMDVISADKSTELGGRAYQVGILVEF